MILAFYFLPLSIADDIGCELSKRRESDDNDYQETLRFNDVPLVAIGRLAILGCFFAAGCMSPGQDGGDHASGDSPWGQGASFTDENTPGTYGFRVRLQHDSDPRCTLFLRATVSPREPGIPYILLQRDPDDQLLGVSWLTAAPLNHVQIGGAVDSWEVTQGLEEQSGHVQFERTVKTSTQRPHLDVEVMVKQIDPGTLLVSLLCEQKPAHVTLERLVDWHVVAPGTNQAGVGATVCYSCPATLQVANQQQIDVDVGGERAELLFGASGRASSGSVQWTHPGGEATWELPRPGDSEFIIAAGEAGRQLAHLDWTRMPGSEGTGSYMLSLSSWEISQTFQ